MVPYPDPVVIALLLDLVPEVGQRISTSLEGMPGLPALRITNVTHREAPSAHEGTPIFQIEVWADDELVSGQLAWRIRNLWPSVIKQVVGDALVIGRWVDSDPHPSPDPETELPRHLLTVGIRLTGASNE